MKRHSFLALILCALFVVVGTGCSSQNSGTQSGAAQKTTKSAQLANPVKTYDSLAKAEKAAGFKFTVPEGVNVNGADSPSTTGAPSTMTSSKSAMAARAMKCATCAKPASTRATRPAK